MPLYKTVTEKEEGFSLWLHGISSGKGGFNPVCGTLGIELSNLMLCT